MRPIGLTKDARSENASEGKNNLQEKQRYFMTCEITKKVEITPY